MKRYVTTTRHSSRVFINWTRPEDVVLNGIATGPAGNVKLLAANDDAITVKIGGWSENPGSRYSGLRSYYPATVETYLRANAETGDGRDWCYPLISHDVRPKKA